MAQELSESEPAILTKTEKRALIHILCEMHRVLEILALGAHPDYQKKKVESYFQELGIGW